MHRFVVTVSLLAVIVGVLVAGGRPDAGARQATPAPARHPVVGSWQVLVAFEGQPRVELANLITFTDEGTVLAAGAGQLPALPAAFGAGLFLTEGHGAWAATGARSAEATFRFLTLDQTGGLASTNTTRMAIEVDAAGTGFAGSFTLDSVSPSGNPMGSGRGTVRAARIGVEPAATPAVATPVA